MLGNTGVVVPEIYVVAGIVNGAAVDVKRFAGTSITENVVFTKFANGPFLGASVVIAPELDVGAVVYASAVNIYGFVRIGI